MKNITKIGLSALAGALAMTSANAGSLALSGSMEATYTTGSGYGTTGSNPFGMDKELSVTGSAELDNGTAVNYKQTITDALAFNDSEIAFVIDGLGTIALTSTGTPISAIDNVTPTAFEEAEAGLTTGLDDVNGADGDYGIRWTLADVAGSGFTLDTFWTPEHGSGDATADNAASGATYSNKDDAFEIVLKGSTPVEGLDVGIGYARLNSTDTDTTGVAQADYDQDEGTAYATYAIGPAKVGYQKSAVSIGSTNVLHETDYFGISYAVSDNLSVSYSRVDADQTTAGTTVKQNMDGISMSYSMGGLTLNIANNDCNDCSYTSGRNQDWQSMSLAIAF
jgi:outer membrane protein OmpU